MTAEEPGFARPAIERRTVEHIPRTERHGRARDLFTIWFGTSLTLVTIATGFIPTAVYRLPFWWSAGALLFGCVIGGVVMALHAAQGPQTGVPQMLQTRAQFGSYGSLLVIVLVVFMYVGFFASNLVLGGQSIAEVFGVANLPAIVFVGVLSCLAAVVGYRFIHRFARLMSFVAGGALLVAFIWIVGVNGVPGSAWTTGDVTAFGIMGSISLAALWLIACAPFVSDYTRYMPKDTGVRPAFWSTYAGAVVGSFLPMALGSLLGAVLPEAALVGGLASLTDGVSGAVIVIFSIALVSQSAMFVYCGSLSTLTVGQTLFADWAPRAAARALVAIVMFVVAILLAVVGSGDFLNYFANFLLILLCVLIPWTAINLIDYYAIKHGRYDIPSMFEQDGGRYGKINGPAAISYFVGIAVQIPFLSTPLYTGPLAERLGGVDVSWIVGLVIVCPLYYALMVKYGDAEKNSDVARRPRRSALADLALNEDEVQA